MSTVFISYRRQSAAGEARALFNDFVARLGQSAVFMDVDSISLGRDFRSELQKNMTACTVVLVLIDKEWATLKDEMGRRRLENADDYIRMEVEAAIKRDIVVTPVLVKGAQMPAAEELPAEIRDLAYRNGFELTHNRWESDVKEMIRRLGLGANRQGGQVETEGQPLAPREVGDEAKSQGRQTALDDQPREPGTLAYAQDAGCADAAGASGPASGAGAGGPKFGAAIDTADIEAQALLRSKCQMH
jgi:hypothetical protein